MDLKIIVSGMLIMWQAFQSFSRHILDYWEAGISDHFESHAI